MGRMFLCGSDAGCGIKLRNSPTMRAELRSERVNAEIDRSANFSTDLRKSLEIYAAFFLPRSKFRGQWTLLQFSWRRCVTTMGL